MDTLTDDPVPDKPRRRISFIAFGLFVIICVGVGVMHRPILEWWIRREALARGFELEFAGLSIVPDRLVLRQTHVRLVGVSGVDVRIDELVVDLHGMDPLRIQGRGARIDVDRSSDELQQALVSFGNEHKRSVRLPVMLDGDFRYGDRDNPAVVFSGKATSLGDGDLSFDGTFRVSQAKLGTLKLHRSKENKIDLGFGLMLSEKPVVHVLLDASANPFQGSVTFAAQKVDDVCKAFALPIPKGFSGSSVEGTVKFVVDGALPANPHHGTAAFVVTGWIPPHPRELDGLVYGRTTKFGAAFEVLPDLSEIRFPKATVEAGAFRLEGKGNTVRDGLSARTRMDLVGNVACTELGASAIGSHVQGVFGDILRSVARMTMGGTVKIRVTVDADTKSLSTAKVDQSVEVGCRLR